MNKLNEIAKEYIEGEHIKPMSKETFLSSKEELFNLLKCWKIISKANTIGNLAKFKKNQKTVILNIGNSSYFINADTTVAGVLRFLENQSNDLPWKIIESNRGNINKVTNNKNYDPIEGFYMYRV
jgi:hypothetical protein